MQGGTSFSRKEASTILFRTLRSVGYPEESAENALWSALWLEDRHAHGVLWLIVFLCFAKEAEFEELKPRVHEEWGLTGTCPFMLAEAILSREAIWKRRGGVAFGAPFYPILMLPVFVDWFRPQGLNIEATYLDHSLVAAHNGLAFNDDNSAAFDIPNTLGKEPIIINLSAKVPAAERTIYRRATQISLPASRLRGMQALNLSDRE